MTTMQPLVTPGNANQEMTTGYPEPTAKQPVTLVQDTAASEPVTGVFDITHGSKMGNTNISGSV